MPAASLEADAAQSSLKAVSGKEPTLPRDTDATRFLPDGEQPVRHPRTENGATPGKTPAPNYDGKTPARDSGGKPAFAGVASYQSSKKYVARQEQIGRAHV